MDQTNMGAESGQRASHSVQGGGKRAKGGEEHRGLRNIRGLKLSVTGQKKKTPGLISFKKEKKKRKKLFNQFLAHSKLLERDPNSQNPTKKRAQGKVKRSMFWKVAVGETGPRTDKKPRARIGEVELRSIPRKRKKKVQYRQVNRPNIVRWQYRLEAPWGRKTEW